MHQGQLCSAGLIGSAATAPKSAVVAASLDVDAQPSTGSVRPSLSGDHQVQREGGKGKRKGVRDGCGCVPIDPLAVRTAQCGAVGLLTAAAEAVTSRHHLLMAEHSTPGGLWFG